jgi:N-acetylglucosamine-6-phosphate deacetylase
LDGKANARFDLGICAGTILTPYERIRDSIVAIRDGKIAAIEPYREDLRHQFKRLVDARHSTLVPGFVDIQVNGGLGSNFATASTEERQRIYHFFLARGTTTLVPTVTTASSESLIRGLGALAEDVGHSRDDMPSIPGIHLEGPFLNKKRRGAHPEEHVVQPDLDLAPRFWEAAGGKIAITTLAPELDGAFNLIRWFSERGAIVSAGHTQATCTTLLNAWDIGLSLLTHMGNVSDWPHRRRNEAGIFVSEPGLVGAFIISGLLRGSIILDGYHFDPRLAYALVRARGTENVVLISDASYATGCQPGEYNDGVMPTTVHEDNFAYVTGGDGWLAGSVITLARAIRVAVREGSIPLRDAVIMATATPANVLRLEGVKGRVAPGYDADFALLDGDLHVWRVFRAGLEVPERSQD